MANEQLMLLFLCRVVVSGSLFNFFFMFVCLLVEGIGGGHGKRRKVTLYNCICGEDVSLW